MLKLIYISWKKILITNFLNSETKKVFSFIKKKIEVIASISFQDIRHTNFEKCFKKNALEVLQVHFKDCGPSYFKSYYSVNFTNSSIKFERHFQDIIL